MVCATSLLLRLLLRTLADIRRLLLLRCCCGRCCGCCCYGAPWWRLSSPHEVRLSRRSRALANARARRGAQQRRGREHAYVLDKPRMPMAVPTPLPIAIERRSGCHGREILRRDVEPASKLTCSLRYARRPDAPSCSRPSSAAAAATCATSCAARSGRRARARPSAQRTLATARAVPIRIRWCLSFVVVVRDSSRSSTYSSTYSSSSPAAKGRRCVGIVVGVVIVFARFALGGARFG